jgi:aquaporin Z
MTGGFASNGYEFRSPGGHSLVSRLLDQVVLSCFVLLVIMGATDKGAPKGLAHVAIGPALTLIHLVQISVTNKSVSRARSTGPAIFVGGQDVQQFWLLWLAPLAAKAVGGVIYKAFSNESAKVPQIEVRETPTTRRSSRRIRVRSWQDG